MISILFSHKYTQNISPEELGIKKGELAGAPETIYGFTGLADTPAN
jgi:hypothetical protein